MAVDPQRTRVTVLGPTGRADLAVPRRVPAALLLPLLLAELKIKAGSADATWEITHADGRAVDPDSSLADSDVADGDMLFLRRAGEGEPVRYDDVCEIVADEGARDRWRSRDTVTAAGAAGAVLTLIALTGIAVRLEPSVRAPASAALFGLLVACLVLVSRSRAMRRFASMVLVLAGVCAAVMTDALVGERPGGTGMLAAAAAFGACCIGGGRLVGRHAVVVYAGALVATLGAAAGTVVFVTGRPVMAAAICGALAVVSLALAPGLALRMTGVMTIGCSDDRDIAGTVSGAVPACDARARVHDAERALLGMVSGAAAAVLVASVVLTGSRDPTARGLACALALLTVIRARDFRHRYQVAALSGAGACALAVVAAGLASLGGWMPLVAAAAAAACFVFMSAIELRWAGYRVRRAVGLVDSVLMCAVPPAVLAIGGAYGALLEIWD